MFTTDISHLAIPKGGLDLFLNSSDCGAERLCESLKTLGLHCIKHYSSSVTSVLISGFGCVRDGDGVITAVWFLGCIPDAQTWIHLKPL